MAKMTPQQRARGRYVLKAPFSANPNVIYTCIAIRSFEDIYDAGYDVYKTYYEPYGVIEGSIIGGSPFSFAAETSLLPNIISLLGADGSTIHVPDTFIQSFPNVSEVRYSRIVLSAELPPLPDTSDLTAVKTMVANLISATYGVTPVIVEEHRAPTEDNPTDAEHQALESARLLAITRTETDAARVNRLDQENSLLRDQITKLTAILTANGWLPT